MRRIHVLLVLAISFALGTPDVVLGQNKKTKLPTKGDQFNINTGGSSHSSKPTGTQAATTGNPNCAPPQLPGGGTPKNWSCPTGTQCKLGTLFGKVRRLVAKPSGSQPQPLFFEQPAEAKGPPSATTDSGSRVLKGNEMQHDSFGHGTDNKMAGRSDLWNKKRRLFEDMMRGLEQKGYWIAPIKTIKSINNDPRVHFRDGPLSAQRLGKGFSLVANGGFTTAELDPANPKATKKDPKGREIRKGIVPVIRDGKLDSKGIDLVQNRGGVAMLKDGSIVVMQQVGGTAEALQKVFGEGIDNPVVEFMGGGGQLIANGNAISNDNLSSTQRFSGGINAPQFRFTDHTLIGIYEGQAFVIHSPNKTETQLQADLLKAHFSAVVKLDGGGGIFWDDGKLDHAKSGNNVLGIGINVKS